MPDRAALVTGASSGIGLAIAHMLGEEGHGLTVAARRPEKLTAAADELRAAGYEVEEVAANLAEEDDIQRVVARHRERFGRLDVLVNTAGVGIGAPVGGDPDQARRHAARRQPAGDGALLPRVHDDAARGRRRAPHALVVNLSSISGKSRPALAVGLLGDEGGRVGFTQAMNKELNAEGIKSVALAPASSTRR